MAAMDQNLLASVIIAVYNGETFLAEAIESALAQTYWPREVIVVDDGSGDRSADIARSYAEVRYLYQENQGLAAARNRGVAAARGEFISFLDADDRWMPHKLEVQIDYLLENPGCGLAFCRLESFFDGTNPLPEFARAIEGEQVAIAGMVARRSALEKVGPFDPSYKLGSDFEWVTRAKDSGISMKVLPDVLVQRRIHATNMSHDVEGRRAIMFRMLRSSIWRKNKRGAAT